jgi:nicotinamidase-related amidase
MVNFPVVPARMALVNIDIQNAFVESTGQEGLALVERINRLAQECRDAGILVFHLRHTLPAGFYGGVLAEFFPIVNDTFLNRDSHTASFYKGLIIDPRDVLLEKPHYGGFYDTNLELLLRRQGIDTIIITGIHTHVCCETTAREAMVRDFRVFFLSDGTTTVDSAEGLTREEKMRATLGAMRNNFAQVLTVDEMIQKIQATAVMEDDRTEAQQFSYPRTGGSSI